jgi:hypothetical protein
LKQQYINTGVELLCLLGFIDYNSNVTFTLGENVTLQGSSGNSKPLIKVQSGGTFIMEAGSKVTGNTCRNTYSSWGGSAGGVEVDQGTFIMNGGEVSGNTFDYSGDTGASGVFIWNGTFTMNGGVIYGTSGNLPVGVSADKANTGFQYVFSVGAAYGYSSTAVFGPAGGHIGGTAVGAGTAISSTAQTVTAP